ncbi:MAG: radical SAM protein [Egibacteraceae bacterium]
MVNRIHDFVGKLQQPSVVRHVEEVLSAMADPQASSFHGPGPVSINLDVTTACNYKCDHCIDFEILNTGEAHGQDTLLESLVTLSLAGLRSVILIGGGEPTVYPHFVNIVRAIKLLNLQCAIVSNGGRPARLAAVADQLTPGDWIRLSLDAGTEETFIAMHRPLRGVTLHGICEMVAEAKKINPEVRWGFSYIVSWPGLTGPNLVPLMTNTAEMARATVLAKESGFDYITFKPMLQRDSDGAETIRWPAGEAGERLRAEINAQLDQANEYEDESFSVLESLNMGKAALDSDNRLHLEDPLRNQPKNCYMHFLRQVLTPTGLYGCPVYRGNSKDQLGGPDAFAGIPRLLATLESTRAHVGTFDARYECRNVACLSNAANWWIDSLSKSGQSPQVGVELDDYYM